MTYLSSMTYLSDGMFKFLFLTRNRKIIAADCTKKKARSFFSNLDSSEICDNKTFWKTIQSFFLKNEKLQTGLPL